MNSPTGTPIVLTANASLDIGKTAQPDLSLLVPPVERPMLVHDINFIVRSPSGLNASITPLVSAFFLPFIRAKLILGRYAMTDGFIPLCNFGPRYSYVYDALGSIAMRTVGALQTGDLVSGESEIYNHRRWILPRPMYMATGEMLQATFSFVNMLPSTFPSGMTTGWDIRISVHGLLLPRELAVPRMVPYVSCFTPDLAQAKSGETDLKNQLSKPIELQRLVGQAWAEVSAVQGPFDLPFFANGMTGISAIKLQVGDTTGMKITHTGQQAASNTFVDFFSMFPSQEPVFAYKRMLNPGEKLDVEFDPTSLYIEQSSLYTQLAFVSMIGHREE